MMGVAVEALSERPDDETIGKFSEDDDGVRLIFGTSASDPYENFRLFLELRESATFSESRCKAMLEV